MPHFQSLVQRLPLTAFVAFVAGGVALWSVYPENFITDDSYFYMVIARNMALYGEHSFSRIIPTNGFHPLWGYLLSVYSYLVASVNPAWLWNAAYLVPINAALLGVILWKSWQIAVELELDGLIVASVPALFTLLGSLLGSEGVLSLAMLLWLVQYCLQQGKLGECNSWKTGLLAALCVLARLDFVFVVGVFYLVGLADTQTRRQWLIAAVVAAIPIGAYVAFNHIKFGGAMPVSGWIKGSFPRPELRGLNFSKGFMRSSLAGYSLPLGWLPLVIGGATLWLAKNITSSQRRIVAILWIGTSLHLAYVGLFSRFHTIWHWYYILPITMTAVCLGIAAEQPWHWRLKPVVLMVLFAATALGLYDKMVSNFMRGTREAALEAVADRDNEGNTFLFSDFPGYPAYHLKYSTVFAGDMLTSNRRFFADLVDSGNALQRVFDTCRDAQRPVSTILIVGSRFLDVDQAGNKLILYNAKEFPQLDSIGELPTQRLADGTLRCANGATVLTVD